MRPLLPQSPSLGLPRLARARPDPVRGKSPCAHEAIDAMIDLRNR
jgi:hypothetical protein